MPSARGIRAGAAYVELHAKDSRLPQDLKRAPMRLKAFVARVAGIGKRPTTATAVAGRNITET